MSDEILTPFRRNDYTWRGKAKEENVSLKMRFKQAMTNLKESFRVEYDDEPDVEEVD